MNAEIHQLRPRPTVNWMCSACGVDAGCNCGAPLMSKSQQAAEKLMANPNRSDRSIAAEIGMSQPGVSKVRHKLETDNRLSVDDEPH